MAEVPAHTHPVGGRACPATGVVQLELFVAECGVAEDPGKVGDGLVQAGHVPRGRGGVGVEVRLMEDEERVLVEPVVDRERQPVIQGQASEKECVVSFAIRVRKEFRTAGF